VATWTITATQSDAQGRGGRPDARAAHAAAGEREAAGQALGADSELTGLPPDSLYVPTKKPSVFSIANLKSNLFVII